MRRAPMFSMLALASYSVRGRSWSRRRGEMVRPVGRVVARALRRRIVQHAGIPLFPGCLHRREAVGVAGLQVGAFERIGDDIEQELIIVDLEVLVVAQPV